MENTVENNVLIAEFMGIRYEENRNGHESSDSYYEDIELEYHFSWGWLMPVVEKIFTLQFEDVKGLREHTDEPYTIFDSNAYGLHSKIDSVYEAVVEFIKWYNKTQ